MDILLISLGAISAILILLFIAIRYNIISIRSGRKDISLTEYSNFIKEIERRYNLINKKSGSRNKGFLTGNINDLPFTIKTKFSRERILISLSSLHSTKEHTADKMVISPESAAGRIRVFTGKKDILTGDSRFDKQIYVSGSNEKKIIALLNPEMRTYIIHLLHETDGFTINNTGVKLAKIITNTSQVGTLHSIISNCILIAKGLNRNDSIKKMLMDNCRTETNTKVLHLNMKHLVFQFPDDDEVNAVLKGLIDSKDISIQIQAALYLKQDGLGALTNILKKEPKMETRDQIKIIKILSDNYFLESIPTLYKVYDKTTNDQLKIKIVTTLSEFDDSTISPFLVENLQYSSNTIKPFIIEALGKCGNEEAIEPLQSEMNNCTNFILRKTYAMSITEINTRYGIDSGWLSLNEMEDSDGALSISDEAEKGALSIDDESEK